MNSVLQLLTLRAVSASPWRRSHLPEQPLTAVPLPPRLFSRHAGVYTAEEVALIMREKLIRLQSLYIDQFKRLQHLLKEKKRRYLHSRKGEHEAIGE